METPTLAQLTTVGGITIAVVALNQLLWSVVKATSETKARFGPAIAAVSGVVIGLGAGVILGNGGVDLVQIGVNGFFGGLAAAGLYDLASSKAGVA